MNLFEYASKIFFRNLVAFNEWAIELISISKRVVQWIWIMSIPFIGNIIDFCPAGQRNETDVGNDLVDHSDNQADPKTTDANTFDDLVFWVGVFTKLECKEVCQREDEEVICDEINITCTCLFLECLNCSIEDALAEVEGNYCCDKPDNFFWALFDLLTRGVNTN